MCKEFNSKRYCKYLLKKLLSYFVDRFLKLLSLISTNIAYKTLIVPHSCQIECLGHFFPTPMLLKCMGALIEDHDNILIVRP